MLFSPFSQMSRVVKHCHTPLGFKIQKEEIQMRNLKRALSLALAAIMLIGMMVVSASAAS